jgi:hypothetical protein
MAFFGTLCAITPYVAKKAYRIVYRILQDAIEILEIWGIGKRDKLEIYKIIVSKMNHCRPGAWLY